MAKAIADTARVYPNVQLGDNITIEDFCVIGAPPRGKAEGELSTTIGSNSFIRSHTVIYAGNAIGTNFQTGNKANIREENTIGNNVSIGTLSVIEHHVKIADRVRIHSQVFIPEYCTLEEECWIGPNVVFTNAKYPNRPETKNNLTGVRAGAGAVVGANVTVLPGITLGKKCLIGAGAVVVKDVPDQVTARGNPARWT